MVRTTIMVPVELKVKAIRLARQMGVSFGEIVRTSLEETVLKRKGKRGERKNDSFFSDKAAFSGPWPRDGAKNHDKYLYDRPDGGGAAAARDGRRAADA